MVKCVWDKHYCTTASGTLLSTRKAADVVEQAGRFLDIEKALGYDRRHVMTQMARTHDPYYVKALFTGEPRALATSQGFEWSPAFAHSLGIIWHGHQWACGAALGDGGFVLHPVSGAHHAQYKGGAGFCSANFLVGAHKELRRQGCLTRSLVIDLDAHPGDGTLELRPEGMALFDIAGSVWCSAPRTFDCQYHYAKNHTEYFSALTALPDMLDKVKPELVQYQAGMDVYEKDHVGGIRGMTAEHIFARDMFVLTELARRNISTVVNLAGGYVEGETINLHVATIAAMDQVQQLMKVRAA